MASRGKSTSFHSRSLSTAASRVWGGLSGAVSFTAAVDNSAKAAVARRTAEAKRAKKLRRRYQSHGDSATDALEEELRQHRRSLSGPSRSNSVAQLDSEVWAYTAADAAESQPAAGHLRDAIGWQGSIDTTTVDPSADYELSQTTIGIYLSLGNVADRRKLLRELAPNQVFAVWEHLGSTDKLGQAAMLSLLQPGQVRELRAMRAAMSTKSAPASLPPHTPIAPSSSAAAWNRGQRWGEGDTAAGGYAEYPYSAYVYDNSGYTAEVPTAHAGEAADTYAAQAAAGAYAAEAAANAHAADGATSGYAAEGASTAYAAWDTAAYPAEAYTSTAAEESWAWEQAAAGGEDASAWATSEDTAAAKVEEPETGERFAGLLGAQLEYYLNKDGYLCYLDHDGVERMVEGAEEDHGSYETWQYGYWDDEGVFHYFSEYVYEGYERFKAETGVDMEEAEYQALVEKMADEHQREIGQSINESKMSIETTVGQDLVATERKEAEADLQAVEADYSAVLQQVHDEAAANAAAVDERSMLERRRQKAALEDRRKKLAEKRAAAERRLQAARQAELEVQRRAAAEESRLRTERQEALRAAEEKLRSPDFDVHGEVTRLREQHAQDKQQLEERQRTEKRRQRLRMKQRLAKRKQQRLQAQQQKELAHQSRRIMQRVMDMSDMTGVTRQSQVDDLLSATSISSASGTAPKLHRPTLDAALMASGSNRSRESLSEEAARILGNALSPCRPMALTDEDNAMLDSLFEENDQTSL